MEFFHLVDASGTVLSAKFSRRMRKPIPTPLRFSFS